MAHLLGAENLSLEYPTRTVFSGVSVGISEGDRIGIVGRNGDGKSSLLAMLTGELTPNSGKVTRRGGVTFGVLSQQDQLDEAASVGTNIVGDTPEHQWAGNPRTRDIIDGLVRDLPWEGTVSMLSGGQRRRVALAKLLVQDWDILALDEPTNHLDVEGISWLASHLQRRWQKQQGALLVITHDRWFLDTVCTTTWEVHDGIVEPFEGGYAAYVLQRLERNRIAAQAEQKRQNLLRKELAWLRRGAPARTSKPKFRVDAANALIADVPPLRDTVALQRLAVARLGKDVVRLSHAGVSFPVAPSAAAATAVTTGTTTTTDTAAVATSSTGPVKEVLRDITWDLAPGERTGILGPNGAGKSTLLNLIAGTITPTSGRVKHGKTVQIAVLDQRFSQLTEIARDRVREVLARTKTVFEVDGKELSPAQLLERLGFRREQLSTPVGELSGGQKRRLQLLLILLSQPNVLILDEPTNDVDADMLAAMEDLLDSWPGTLLVVSHDRYLLERVTDQQYAVLDGTLRHLPRGVDEYLELRTAQQREATKQSAPAQATAGEHADGGSTSQNAANSGKLAATGLSGAERRAAEKELTAITRKLEKLESRIAQADNAMAQIPHTDYERLAQANQEALALRDEVQQLEERWLEISEQLG
ncbi:ABC-F family ATP-binding cassette domain-containing protein [Canibacter oris]|uniref:ATPase subunit of ABC transporter with duplicated ATPase domains n=1 Tax=Canibacter oris TaxID=1365628 RepID=A0A840DLM4_9MICO|nr:ABC-F family ATP-binding cassette domain-containing protein [Canibacter oris]MBB4070887.1 ATPase subunit of ABC transporter with duplicated ATPase domains [Canibacter oris]